MIPGIEQLKTQRTMLIVDDQLSVRTTLDYLLGLDGYRVLTADSGIAAVAIAEREVIDGALIDINMPVMDGFATCIRLQQAATARGHPLRVWFMSGAFSGAVKRKGTELGAMGVFSKPFDPDDLSKRLLDGFTATPGISPPAEIAHPSAELEGDSGP